MLNRCLATFEIGIGLLIASLITGKANIIQTATATLSRGTRGSFVAYLLEQT